MNPLIANPALRIHIIIHQPYLNYQPESHQLSLQKVSQFIERPRPVDRSDKNLLVVRRGVKIRSFVNFGITKKREGGQRLFTHCSENNLF